VSQRAALRALVGARVIDFDALAVRAVLLAPAATPFPGAAPSFRGLLAWRDHVVPLVSLAPGHRGRLAVVIDGGAELIAVEVDGVDGVFGEGGGEPVDLHALASLVRAAPRGEPRAEVRE